MSDISKKQMESAQLARLAAQRQLYSDAKRIQAVHMILSVPCVIILSILVALYPGLQSYAAFWGIAIAVLDVVLLTPWQKSLIQRAAKIQELFDCYVLEMEWNTITVGSRPDTESIVAAANRYKKNDPEYEKLKNWYPGQVDKLPIHLARLVCQRANCWWDAQLRRRYANLAIAIVVFLVITVFLVGLIGGLTLEKLLLAICLPLMPGFLWGLRQFKENREVAAILDDLRNHVQILWDKSLNGQVDPIRLAADSRKLQDEIYARRGKTPLIFDRIYFRLRDEQEEQMNIGVDTLIDEVLKAG